MMSQAIAISQPPPSAKPLTAAIIGLGQSKSAVIPPKPPATGAKRGGLASRDISAVYLRSLPAEKARSPAPVRIAIQASSSLANRFQASASSAVVGG